MKGAAILDDILCGSRGEIRYQSRGAMIAAVRDKAEWDWLGMQLSELSKNVDLHYY